MKLIIDDEEFEIKSLDLRDGDIVIIKHPGCISHVAIDNITQSWNRKFPNIKAVVLSEGMDINVLRPVK
jgi:hypothetical protein